ncbi:ATP12 family chaperone protein [Sphingomonas kyeonggiensis]|uniref:Chaperone required for assembly of F1-ATPase n=1 Tax=Sphingomonas kyeonggiensis TaxID=1268553 RepID=A0A7W6NUX7_9SPHN|nr:ATP12 family protein [Sphingomonas kyeonggiensis]MBB4096533.1 chaperone required for assembly of F1-ATPase [Sphingomonas kyeonggiensis]
MKRFWKEVSVENGQVALDGKPVRTPDRAPLALPTPALAEGVAEEWRAVGETLDPRAMKLTGLANAAIDKISADPAPFAQGLAAYGESDLLYYRAEDPEPLVLRQAEAWDPLLDWARSRYDVHFETATGVIHKAQPEATIARLAEAVHALDPFHIAGLSPVVTISGSLVGALALLEGAIPAEGLWQAAHVDELWQAEQWGEDELALAARDNRRTDFLAGVRFLGLL